VLGLCPARGACWVDPRDPLLANVIKVVHFGFHQHNTKLPGDFQLMPQKGEACFEPERDIVAAPYSYKQEAIANETYSSFDPNAIPSERLLFFAGSIHTDEPDYSGGVRQVSKEFMLPGGLRPCVCAGRSHAGTTQGLCVSVSVVSDGLRTALVDNTLPS